MVTIMLVEIPICDLLFLKSKIPRGKNVWSSEVEIFHFNWLFGLLVNLYPAEVPKSRLRTLHLRGQLNTPHHTYPPLVTLLCPNTKNWRVLTFWTLTDLKLQFFCIIEKQALWSFSASKDSSFDWVYISVNGLEIYNAKKMLSQHVTSKIIWTCFWLELETRSRIVMWCALSASNKLRWNEPHG